MGRARKDGEDTPGRQTLHESDSSSESEGLDQIVVEAPGVEEEQRSRVGTALTQEDRDESGKTDGDLGCRVGARTVSEKEVSKGRK